MIKALSFVALLVIGLWYGPWWCIALIGILYGLSHKGKRPWSFCWSYGALTLALVFVLTWVTDSHSSMRASTFLGSALSLPAWALYGLSSMVFAVVVGLSCLTGALIAESQKS